MQLVVLMQHGLKRMCKPQGGFTGSGWPVAGLRLPGSMVALHEMNTPSLHRTVKAAGWVSLVTDLSSDMIYPLLPVFLQAVLKSSMAWVGLIEGTAETTAALLKLASGYISDRWKSRKGLVFLGYTLSALTRPLLALTGNASQVLALRTTDRIGKGVRGSPRAALIADVTAPENRGLAFGFQRAMDHAGAFMGPLVAAGVLWLLQDRWQWTLEDSLRGLFLWAALPGLLAPFIIWKFITEPPHVAPPGPPNTAPAPPLPRPYYHALAAMVVFTLGNSSDAFLILLATRSGVPVWQVPFLWALLHAVKMSSAMPGGRLSDHWGRKPVLLLGWGLYALCYLLFGFATAPWQIWTLFAVYGVYYGCTEGAEKALIADLVPAARRGTAFGIYHTVEGLAAFPASLLFGALWQFTGTPVIPFAAGALLAALAGLLLWPLKFSNAWKM